MTRITSTVLVMMVLLNGAVTVMAGSGVSEDIGVSIAPGIEETMGDVVSNAKAGFEANEGLGDTLFALFAAAMSTFELLISGVFAAPSMFLNLGFPAWFVLPVFAPMYIVGTLELMYVASGRDMV